MMGRRTQVGALLVWAIAMVGASQMRCGYGECDDVFAPEYQSGTFTVGASAELAVIEFADDDASFTVTYEDGTVETFTRTGRIRRYELGGRGETSF